MHNLQLIGQYELFKDIIGIVWCSHMKNMSTSGIMIINNKNKTENLLASTLLYVCVTACIFFSYWNTLLLSIWYCHFIKIANSSCPLAIKKRWRCIFALRLGGYKSVKAAVKASSPQLKELLTHQKQFHLSWCQWRVSMAPWWCVRAFSLPPVSVATPVVESLLNPGQKSSHEENSWEAIMWSLFSVMSVLRDCSFTVTSVIFFTVILSVMLRYSNLIPL